MLYIFPYVRTESILPTKFDSVPRCLSTSHVFSDFQPMFELDATNFSECIQAMRNANSISTQDGVVVHQRCHERGPHGQRQKDLAL
ncbi:hypothetical protein BDR03DRAFT_591944 [Suillus americanus]|nr:hypothetical protein BDR03DRAFT_591944 [Suillus americanus]